MTKPKEYDELRIRIWNISGDKYFVLASGFASASAILDLRGSPDFHDEFDRLLREELAGEAPASQPVWTRLQAIGDELGELFFPPAIADCYGQCQRFAQERNNGLRLRFFLPKTLSRVPVELLKTSGNFLALNQGGSIVRTVPAQVVRRRRSGQKQEPFTILLASASPKDYKQLSVDQEMRQLQQELAYAIGTGAVNLVQLEHVTRHNLQSALDNVKGECALLILGHGEYEEKAQQGVVVLEDGSGGADRVNQDVLAGLLAGVPGLHFVALNLCKGGRTAPHDHFSGVAGRLIGVGIPMVAAFQFPVSDTAARRFSQELLKEICKGSWIDKAVASARLMMHGTEEGSNIEWCTPMLCLHEDWVQTQLLPEEGSQQQPPTLGTVEHARWLVRETRRNEGWEKAAHIAQGACDRFPADTQLQRAHREASIEVDLVSICQNIGGLLAGGRAADAFAESANGRLPAHLSGLIQPLRDLANARINQHRDLSAQYETAKGYEGSGDIAGAYPIWRDIWSTNPDFKDVRERIKAPIDVFVSYAASDGGLVRELFQRLRAEGKRVWFQNGKDQGEGLRADELAAILARSHSILICLSDAYCLDDDTKLELNLVHANRPAGEHETTVPVVVRDGPIRPVPHYLRLIPWITLTDHRQILEAISGRNNEVLPQPPLLLTSTILKNQTKRICSFLYEKEIGGAAPPKGTKELVSELLNNADLQPEVRMWIGTLKRYCDLTDKAGTGPLSLDPALQALKDLIGWASHFYRVTSGPRDPFRAFWFHAMQHWGHGNSARPPLSNWELAEGRRRLTSAGAMFRLMNVQDESTADMLLIPVNPTYSGEAAAEVSHCLSLGNKSPLVVLAHTRLPSGPAGDFEILVFGHPARCSFDNLRDRFQPLNKHIALAVARQIAAAFLSLHTDAPVLAQNLFRYGNVTLDLSGSVRLAWDWEPESTATNLLNCVREQFWFSRAGELPEENRNGWPSLRRHLSEALNGLVSPQILQAFHEAASPQEALASLSANVVLPADDSVIVSVLVDCWSKNQHLPDWMNVPDQPRPAEPPQTPPPSQAAGLQLAYSVRLDCLGAWPLDKDNLLVWQSNRRLAIIGQAGTALWSDDKPIQLRIIAGSLKGDLAAGGWEGHLCWFGSDGLQGRGDAGWTIGDVQPTGNGWVTGSWNGRLYLLTGESMKPVLPAPEDGVCRIAVSPVGFATLSMQGIVAMYVNGEKAGQSVAIKGAQSLAFSNGTLVVLTEGGLVTVRKNGETSRPDSLPARGSLRLLSAASTGECFVVNEEGHSWYIDRDGIYPRGPVLRSGSGFLTAALSVRAYVGAAGGGYFYRREGFNLRTWPDALSAAISPDGRRVIIVRPGSIEAYEDLL